ncbi:MAG: radical SAM protein [Myxococcota bacterium]|nr:radical SAM protein [Myxococcota bacterium]
MSLKKRIQRYVFWKRHEMRIDRLVRRHELRYLFLEVTRRCNLHCRYCGSSCTPKEQSAELSTEAWLEIIEQIAHDFDPKRIMVAVTGGEPMLREGVFEIFAALRKHRFPFGMVSNGTLITPEVAQKLTASGIRSISLSMDALPELNDQLRGRGSSQKVIDAIQHLRDAGYRGKLEIISTITKPAVATLDEMRAFVASLRLPLWRVAPVMPIGRAAEQPELIPNAADIRAILEFVRASRIDKAQPAPEFSEEGFLGERFEGAVRPYLCQCRAGVSIAGIRANGKIGACPELSTDFDQGDIKSERLSTVWKSRYRVFRDRRWTKKGPCASCDRYHVCRGGALHLYPNAEGDFLRCLYLMCKESDTEPTRSLIPTIRRAMPNAGAPKTTSPS